MFSSKVIGFMALLATLCFVLLVVLQVVEWMYYGADPSVWSAAGL